MNRSTFFIYLTIITCCYSLSWEKEMKKLSKSGLTLEILEFTKSTTNEEYMEFKEVVQNTKEDGSFDDFLIALKVKSPYLHTKTLKMHNRIQEQINKLGEEAQPVIKRVFVDLAISIKAAILGEGIFYIRMADSTKLFRAEYKKLSEDAKKSIAEHFPVLNLIVNESN